MNSTRKFLFWGAVVEMVLQYATVVGRKKIRKIQTPSSRRWIPSLEAFLPCWEAQGVDLKTAEGRIAKEKRSMWDF